MLEFVDRVWDTMEAIGTRPFGQLNTLENKNIYKKGMLILSEVKVCYAQRAHIDKSDEDLPSKKLYNTEELTDFNNMASIYLQKDLGALKMNAYFTLNLKQ